MFFSEHSVYIHHSGVELCVVVFYAAVEFYLYPTVSTALVHSVKPKLTE